MSLNLSDPAQLFAAKTQEYSRMFGLADTRTMPGFGLPQGGALAQVLKGLSQAFQGLADMIGGLGSMSGTAPFGTPVMHLANGAHALPAFPSVTPSAANGAGMKPIAGTARIWGDPHFIGADGDKFDVQGEAGKTYNLLSDRGFQMNGRFDSWGGAGATVVGEVGINAGTNYINVDKSGKAVVNGHVLKDGERVALRDGGYVEKKGNEVTVKAGEWEVNFQTHRDHINMDIKTQNAVADGVKPQGLIGQTFDGDGKALIGDAGTGAQGGGAIRGADGKIAAAGDKTAVKSYEVSALFDTNFKHHNADAGQASLMLDAMRGELATMAMFGFSLLAGLFNDSGKWGSNSQWS